MRLRDEDKLTKLRGLMREAGVDAYIVPRADEHLGEFVPASAERLAFLTGFTGSAGGAVILADSAVVMSDGRYAIQLKQEVNTTLYTLEDSVSYPLKDWLYDHLKEGQVYGFDPKLLSIKDAEALNSRMEAKAVRACPIETNLIDRIWTDRPAPPSEAVSVFHEEIAGKTREDKLDAVIGVVHENNADLYIVTKPDSISWLLNVRGADLEYMPAALSVACVDAAQGHVDWFIADAQCGDDVQEALAGVARVHSPASLSAYLRARCQGRAAIGLDPVHTPDWFREHVRGSGGRVLSFKDPCIDLKARKTDAEKAAIRAVHVRDGVALSSCLAWLDQMASTGCLEEITECDVAQKLDTLRARDVAYRGESFPAIVGFGPHGAIVHYRATPQHTCALSEGALLIDSGGQYWDKTALIAGTTDVTRTVWLGDVAGVPADLKRHFTLVLKGHIALARAQFQAGTTGRQIDALARQPLQNEGLDYAHGTGHGVGCFGDVHEEAASLSPRGKAALEPGMLLSNEPGYYEEGAYGIRTESLLFVTQKAPGQLAFETVTLAPIDVRLIDEALLSVDETVWLNAYHAQVCQTLSPLVDGLTREWLKQATKAIENTPSVG